MFRENCLEASNKEPTQICVCPWLRTRQFKEVEQTVLQIKYFIWCMHEINNNQYKCSKSQSLLSSTPVSLWMKAGGKMNQTPLSSALTGSHGAGWASRGPLREASRHPCKHHQPGPAVGGAGSRRGTRSWLGVWSTQSALPDFTFYYCHNDHELF